MKLKRNLQEKFNIITTIFVCCILFCLACFVATFSYVPEALVMAASWASASSDTSFTQTGTGTTNNPYKISTATQLATVAKNIGEYYNKSFKLTSNIDVSQNDWVPIGNNVNKYSGTFDGDGHSISGLRIDASATDGYTYAGLFGYLSGATIKNLTLVGGINTYVFAQKSGNVFAGALAGYAEGSNITNILNFNVDVRCVSTASSSYAGGIVGASSASVGSSPVTTKFNRVINMGNVIAVSQSKTASAFAGGIVGESKESAFQYARNDGAINSFYFESNQVFNGYVSQLKFDDGPGGGSGGGSTNPPEISTKTYAGGIVGRGINTTISLGINWAYNTGEINSGISGFDLSSGSKTLSSALPSSSYAGGIAGSFDSMIGNTYNLAKITARAKEKTTTATTTLASSTFLYPAEIYKRGTIEGYTNLDLALVNDLRPKIGSTTFFDTPAYAGGIAGYSSSSILYCYNDGVITGGKKTERLIVANSITYYYALSNYISVAIGDFTFTVERYYSDINGNLNLTSNNAYGNYVSNDYLRSVQTIVYYQRDDLDANSDFNAAIAEQKKSSLSSSSALLKQDFNFSYDPILRDASTTGDYNIAVTSRADGFLSMEIYMSLSYKNRNNNTIGGNIAFNLKNINSYQKINNTFKAASSVTVSDLNGYWAKENGKNGNKPFLKEFYW